MNLKRLVLGAAAGALAVTGASGAAQAADLPVVVDPIDYVRICDAYGVGYYFIPGTETCLRVAGRIRADYNVFIEIDEGNEDLRPATFNPGFGLITGTAGVGVTADNILGDRGFEEFADDRYRFRARGYIYNESRTATEFGLLRTFAEFQFTQDNDEGLSVDLDSGVIQFGGLIFGRTDSLYDFNDADIGSAQFFDYFHADEKVNLIGYQAAFGNGFSAAISLEDHENRANEIVQFVRVANNPATVQAFDRSVGNRGDNIDHVPDIVGNIRVDQGWGSAQIMAAGHQLVASNVTFPNGVSVINGVAQPIFDPPLQRGSGNRDEYGFAAGGGVSVNVPFGNGTTAALTGTYTDGAIQYAAPSVSGAPFFADAIIDENGNIDKVEAFSISGGVATSFTPTVAFALQAGYFNADVPDVNIDINAPGRNAPNQLENLDWEAVSADAFLGYSPVSGMTFGVGAQFLYIDSDSYGEASALSAFFRAQRTF